MQTAKASSVSSADKIKEMFTLGAHFGYSRSSRHPKMKEFLFGLRNNVEIFDLEKTKQKLDEAKKFIKTLGSEKKTVLFVGTKAGIRESVEKYAKEIGMPYVAERWVGGTLTNFKAIKERRDYMEDLMQKTESGELGKYTKKERLMIEKKISRLKYYFSGLEELKNLPSALVIIDTKKEKNAVEEAKKMLIPVIGVMNSDCNPENAVYPIPANDNSMSSVEYLLNELAKAYKEGIKEETKKAVAVNDEKIVE